MSKTYLILMAAAFAAAPFAYSEAPVIHCENTPNVHHYTGGNSRLITGLYDGNLADCDGDFDPTDPWCVAEEVAREDLNGDGLVCEAADFDGHREWATGGAVILSDDGDHFTYGAYACFGDNAHHPQYGPFTVWDAVLGAGAEFIVASDRSLRTPSSVYATGEGLLDDSAVTGVRCGDGLMNRWATCIGTCTVTFPAGLDGAYYVFPLGTAGTVTV